MIKPVRKRARLTTTVFGGADCVPIAERNKDKTTTIRVNDVTMIKIAGAIDKTIDELISVASKGDEKAFWLDYSPLTNNCQQWVTKVLSRNGILTDAVKKWVNQDMEALIKELPHDTQAKAKEITDIASYVNRILQLTTGGRAGFAIGGELGDGRENLVRPKRKGIPKPFGHI